MAEENKAVTEPEGKLDVKQTVDTPKSPSIDIEDLMSKVRQEEKSKLYPQIEKLKADLEEKTNKINSYLISSAEKEETIKELNGKIALLEKEGDAKVAEAKKESSTELEKELEKVRRELEAKNAELQSKDAEFESYKVSKELEAYRAEKLKDVDETVADLVTGNTKEEIDASVEKAKALYEKVLAKVGVKNEPAKNKASAVAKPNLKGTVEVFGELNPEDIRKMSQADWKEYRKRFGLQ